MPLRWRSDGDYVGDHTLVRRMMPFLMRTKNESVVYFEQKIDVAETDRFLREFRERTGLKATYQHLWIWACAKTLRDRPRLNRFTAGGRIYQRRGIWISFSGKKEKTDKHPLVTVKMRCDPDWSLEEVVRQVQDRLGEARSDRKSTTDKEMGLLLKLPAPLLGLVIWAVRLLDRFGLLPKAFIDSDPLFASVFIANLGSIGMGAGYHHLYEYGNIPMFVVVGAARDELVPGPDGEPEVRKRMTVKYTYDERIEDGLYANRALELLRMRIGHPAQADELELAG